MVTIIGLMAAAVWIAVFGRGSKIGDSLHTILIEQPAAWLNAAGPLRLGVALGVLVFMIAAPEFALFMAADLTLYLEVLAATSLAAASLRLNTLVEAATRVAAQPSRLFAVLRARRSAPRRSRPRRPRSPAGRDDSAPGWALA